MVLFSTDKIGIDVDFCGRSPFAVRFDVDATTTTTTTTTTTNVRCRRCCRHRWVVVVVVLGEKHNRTHATKTKQRRWTNDGVELPFFAWKLEGSM